MFATTIISVASCLLVLFVAGEDLPSNFDKCKRDETFDKCLVDAVNKALIFLKDGNSDFGIQPLEPLEVNSLVIESGKNSPITLKQTFKDVKVYHLIGSSKVVKYNTDLNKYLIVCDSKSDRIEVVGNYEMFGRILLFPITGKGRANLTLIDTRIEHRLIGQPVDKDGEHYMVLKDYKVDFRPKRVFMNFDNLFGDKLLSENMNRFLNENWELVFNEMKASYAENFGEVFKNITNKLFSRIPMDKIFIR